MDASATEIAEAISAVLGDASYRDGATAIGKLIEREGGGESATRHVDALLSAY